MEMISESDWIDVGKQFENNLDISNSAVSGIYS